MKLEQRVTEGKDNSVDMCKRNDDRPIFAEITSYNTGDQKFRKKRSNTYPESVQSVGTSNSGMEAFEQLKAPNSLKKENHDFNISVGIDLNSIYARLTEDELLSSDALYSPPRLRTYICSYQNSSSHRRCLQILKEILNILEEMLEDSKEYESVIPEFKCGSEVMSIKVLMKHQLLHLNQHGIRLSDMLAWKFFKIKLKQNFLRSHFPIQSILICLEKISMLLDLLRMI